MAESAGKPAFSDQKNLALNAQGASLPHEKFAIRFCHFPFHGHSSVLTERLSLNAHSPAAARWITG
jgi:hypothetical protein